MNIMTRLRYSLMDEYYIYKKSYRKKKSNKLKWKVVGYRYEHLWWHFWEEIDIVAPDVSDIKLLVSAPKGPFDLDLDFSKPLQYIEETNH